jgi:hypothetical protein
MSKPILGLTQSPILWVLGALSPGIKQQKLEADGESDIDFLSRIRIYDSSVQAGEDI